VITDPNALSLPPKLNIEHIRGFALAAGKIVLGGGVGQMIDMARSNIRNIPRL
jgi:pyruvate dehydrogenase (quinone)